MCIPYCVLVLHVHVHVACGGAGEDVAVPQGAARPFLHTSQQGLCVQMVHVNCGLSFTSMRQELVVDWRFRVSVFLCYVVL